MYDANGNWPDGILGGNWATLGSFSSCYEIQVEDDPVLEDSFGSRYCTVRMLNIELLNKTVVQEGQISSKNIFPRPPAFLGPNGEPRVTKMRKSFGFLPVYILILDIIHHLCLWHLRP